MVILNVGDFFFNGKDTHFRKIAFLLNKMAVLVFNWIGRSLCFLVVFILILDNDCEIMEFYVLNLNCSTEQRCTVISLCVVLVP